MNPDTPPLQPLPPPASQPPLSVVLMVLAIAGIVLGAGGALTYLFCGVGWSIFGVFAPTIDGLPEEILDAAPGGAIGWLSAVMYLVLGLLAIVLLMAGIGLLRRRPQSVSLYRSWSIFKILVVLLSLPLQWAIQIESIEAQSDIPMTIPPLLIVVPSLVMSVLWGMALPVFALIWLRRESVRKEVALWSRAIDEPSDPEFNSS